MTASTRVSTLHLRVTQVRSGIGTKPKHRATLRALGLRGVGRTRVLPDSASVRGMLSRVSHLVEVGPAGSEELQVRQTRRSDVLKARGSAYAKAAKVEKAAKAVKLEKVEKTTKAVKAAKVEKAAKAVKLEKVEKTTKAVRAAKVEKAAKAVKLEKVEKTTKAVKAAKAQKTEEDSR